MATDASALEALMTPWVEDLGFALVRVSLMKVSGRSLIVQVLAERPDGTMSIADCAKLSRTLSARLDETDPVRGRYELEVSSPGIDRPLTKLEDFERFAGRDARIETAAIQAGRRRFSGVIAGVAGDDVILEVEGEPVRIAFESIAKAKLVLSDAALGLKAAPKAAGFGPKAAPKAPGASGRASAKISGSASVDAPASAETEEADGRDSEQRSR